MSEITIGEYLFKRLQELGIQTICGVPGDFELGLLDLVAPSGLKWVGTPNELIGAYAADGYARQVGAAALVTTFGPGELSAICGLGGAYCELVPVVHIVGYPTQSAKESGKILHHTLGDLDYDHYVKISAELSCATTVLKDHRTATSEIDRVLNEMMYQSRPVYIGIAEDIAYTKVPVSSLDTKIMKSLPANDSTTEGQLIQDIQAKLEDSHSPVLIVDGGAARHSWESHVNDLVSALRIPTFVTVLGKGAVDESLPTFAGVYGGSGSWPDVIKLVETSDCVLWLANQPSDFNTGGFTEHVTTTVIVDFQRFFTKIGDTKYKAGINGVLPRLTKAIAGNDKLQSRTYQGNIPNPPMSGSTLSVSPGMVRQDWLWERLSSFLKPGDLIVTETGTSQFGILGTKLPPGASHWTQAVWGSIGYASGAAVGASIGAKQTGKYERIILITGEGSLQLTIQAFSILNRHGIVPIVFILNNGGYTVERYFRGWEANYNDVPSWNYSQLFEAFAPDSGAKGFKITTEAQLDELLNDPQVQNASYPQAIDILLDKEDAPTPLKWVFADKKGLLAQQQK